LWCCIGCCQLDSNKNGWRKVTSKKILIGHLLEKEKEGDQKQDEKSVFREISTMWSTRWRPGGQTSLEEWCRKTLPHVIERLQYNTAAEKCYSCLQLSV
jgi:hypothetical protein